MSGGGSSWSTSPKLFLKISLDIFNRWLQYPIKEKSEIIVYDKIRDSAALWLASFRPRMKNDFWTEETLG
jgi:hypothetical protein